MIRKIFLGLLLVLLYFIQISSSYEPFWDSLDTRPLPSWFKGTKLGILFYWGVHSVPSFGVNDGQALWREWKEFGEDWAIKYMEDNYRKDFTYQDFANDFTGEFFDANQWIDLVAQSGATHVIMHTKYSDGYTMWPSSCSFGWNSVDVGLNKNITALLADATRKAGLKFGVAYYLREYFNPHYLSDKSTNFTERNFPLLKVIPELTDLVNTFKPDILYADTGSSSKNVDTYWNATGFLCWLYNDSPVKDTVVVNDRWGDNDIECKHGDFFSEASCSGMNNGSIETYKPWLGPLSLDKYSWGYRRNASITDIVTTEELIFTLVKYASYGGGLLISVPPSKDGLIPLIFQERLLQLGQWLQINGEAIYNTTIWTYQNDSVNSNVWYTAKDKTVYAIVLDWPSKNLLELGSIVTLLKENPFLNITLLGNENENITWSTNGESININFPDDRSLVNSQWAWVLRFQ